MKLFTIGFTKKSADQFFTTLSKAGVKRLVDVRLNNVSQLAGFSKKDDLHYFLRIICDIEYVHLPSLAPTQGMLDEYKKISRDWPSYEAKFTALIAERHIEDHLDHKLLDQACLLCSENKPDHCHRRIVAEYIRDKWDGVEIIHL